MHPLLITFALLSLIGMTAYGINQRSGDRDLLHHMCATQMDLSRTLQSELQREIYTATILLDRESAPDPVKTAHKKKTTTGERKKRRQILAIPSHLSLHPLAMKRSKKIDATKQIAARLMEELYGHCDFLRNDPEAKSRILDRLSQQLQKAPQGGLVCGLSKIPTDPELLAAIPMGDDATQSVWSKMICGGSDYPSILPFLTMKRIHKINLLFAPEPLLRAYCLDPADGVRIASVRDSALRRFREELEEDENADETTLLDAVRAAMDSVLCVEGIRSEIKLIGEADRVTVESAQGNLTRKRTFRNPMAK